MRKCLCSRNCSDHDCKTYQIRNKTSCQEHAPYAFIIQSFCIFAGNCTRVFCADMRICVFLVTHYYFFHFFHPFVDCIARTLWRVFVIVTYFYTATSRFFIARFHRETLASEIESNQAYASIESMIFSSL